MIGQMLIGLIAVLHVYILVLEMFLWDKPYGLKAFGNSAEKAQLTKVLAQNQGLYNGFLAAGLFWSLLLMHLCGGNCEFLFRLCIDCRYLWWFDCQ
jgi:putative membrane protein